MKYIIGQTVYLLSNNKVCSSPVLSRTFIENDPAFQVYTKEQKDIYQPWGKGGNYYQTRFGIFEEGDLFESKQDLLNSL